MDSPWNREIHSARWPKTALLTANRRPSWMVTRFGQGFRSDQPALGVAWTEHVGST